MPSPLHSPVSVTWFPPLFDEDDMHDKSHLLIIIEIVMAATACIIIFLATLYKILRYYYSRRSYVNRRNPPILFDIRGDSPFSDDEEQEQEQEQAIRHPVWFIHSEGLQQPIIDSITVCKYRKDEGLVIETECVVCLGEFQHEESLKLLPKCNHAFHVLCIDTWLRSHKTCPLCRAPIVHDGAGEDYEADSSVSNMNQGMEESVSDMNEEDSSDDGIQVLLEVSDHYSSIVIGSDSDVSTQEFEDEEELMKRCFSVNSSSDSMVFCDALDLNLDVGIAKQGSESSIDYKLHQRHISMRSSSHNTKFMFSRRSRSQSSILP
uniref:RING-type E3 ubiquitin transferase n=2 Tax=Cajanus cajan TaxID=3821 RepID=A0A151U8Y5_CAJCA|nr:RING-H2 finger protein ATL1O [Cajanus cajan]